MFTFLRALAMQATDVLSYWLTPHPHVGADALWADVTAPRDAAERLADEEAEEEVREAVERLICACPARRPNDGWECLLREGHSGDHCYLPNPLQTTDSDRLDRIAHLLEDIRDIMTSAAPQCDCGLGE
jgi:hypothetical protein